MSPGRDELAIAAAMALHGELDWQTPAKRFDGIPFTDRGFASVPALANVADLLDAILAA